MSYYYKNAYEPDKYQKLNPKVTIKNKKKKIISRTKWKTVEKAHVTCFNENFDRSFLTSKSKIYDSTAVWGEWGNCVGEKFLCDRPAYQVRTKIIIESYAVKSIFSETLTIKC